VSKEAGCSRESAECGLFREPVWIWERWGSWVLVVFFVVFGVLVEYRSAFLRRRMTDLNCYLRASWAVRQGGADLYHVYDDNGWHYNYPPLFAILLTPLADPPTQDASIAGVSAAGLAATPMPPGSLLGVTTLLASRVPMKPEVPPLIPYVPWSISVAIFYLLNLGLLALSLHLLASALEETSGVRFGWRQGVGGRRWFMLRLLPLCACLAPIAHTLMRSQANLYLLALFCGLIAGLIRGRRFQAGLCLAGAICLKIFPAYLLMVPLIRGCGKISGSPSRPDAPAREAGYPSLARRAWMGSRQFCHALIRRDLRCLGGCAAGLVVGLLLIPAAVVGPRQAVNWYFDLKKVLVEPALGMGTDHSRADELTDATASDSQSIQILIHNTAFLDPATRPKKVIPLARQLHWIIGGCLTLATLLAGWRHRQASGPAMAIFVGALVLIMLLLSPVCHTHYFSLAVPLFMGLTALSWDRQAAGGADMRRTRVNYGLLGLLAVMYVGFIPPQLPQFQILRDACWMTYAMLILWGAGCVALWRIPVAVEAAADKVDLARAA
jgi:Glycosyltransferase family 87